MDSLSELVRLLAPSGSIDLHCRIAGAWASEHARAPAGELPYHVVLDGEAIIRSGGTVLHARPGDVLLLPHGAAHTVSVDMPGGNALHGVLVERHFNGLVTEITVAGEKRRLDLLCGTFVLGASASLLLKSLPEMLCISTARRDDCNWVRGLIGMMQVETETPQLGSGAIIAELSTALFTLLLRTLMASGGVTHGLLALLADTRIARAVDAVVSEPQAPWTLDSLAALGNVSRATLARRFMQLGGMTPLDLVTGLRMERAARMLGEGRLSAAAVGEACGYASQAAFGRAFTQYFGVGPGAYRREAAERRGLG